MTDRRDDPERAAREAADWAAQFNSRATDTEALEAFARWRRDPCNAQAYARVEAAWTRAAALGADPEIAAATRDALTVPPKDHSLASRLKGQTTVVVLAASLVVLFTIFVFGRPATYTTNIGEQRLVRLADGSRVRINTDSELSVRINADRRDIELARGEAFFEVAHDAARPFIVVTDRGRIVATGTRFDVDRRESTTRVTLTEGRVRIYDGTDDEGQSPAYLQPGETIRLGLHPRDVPKSIDTELATSWLGGQLVFHRTPLATALDEVNRYTVNKIRLQASTFAAAEVDGRFETGDTASFVDAVTTLFPLRAVTDPDGRITLTAAP